MITKLFGANWKTSLSGLVALVTGAIALKPDIVDFMPDPSRHYIVGISNFVVFISGGAFAMLAKDRNVTGGTTQQTVSGAVADPGTQHLVDETVKASIKSGDSAVTDDQKAAVKPLM